VDMVTPKHLDLGEVVMLTPIKSLVPFLLMHYTPHLEVMVLL